MVLRHLDEDDPHAVRVGEPAFEEASRLLPGLAEHADAGGREPVVLDEDVADLQPR